MFYILGSTEQMKYTALQLEDKTVMLPVISCRFIMIWMLETDMIHVIIINC